MLVKRSTTNHEHADIAGAVSFESTQNYRPYNDNSYRADSWITRKIGTNSIRLATARIDDDIRHLHTSFPVSSPNALFRQDNSELRMTLERSSLLLTGSITGDETWNDYFRLASKYDFAVESAAADAAFSAPGEHALREELVDGTAGKSVARIEELLWLYDSETDVESKVGIAGAITEQLALTLVNYRQYSTVLATPSTIEDDLHNKTDMYIYHMTESGGYKASVQVKTGDDNTPPQNGFTINSSAIGKMYDSLSESMPNKQFQLARLIVSQFNGTSISEKEQRNIKNSLAAFDKHVSDALRESPGIKL